MAEEKLDSLDQQLVSYLQADGRTPYTTLATELGVAEATVRKRVNRLIDSGVLRIVGVTSRERLGLRTQAIVGVKVDGDSVERVIAELQPLDMVRYIGVAAGEFDLILELVAASNEELFTFLTQTLRDIPGVVASQTSLIMKVCKKTD
ncbi:MAG: Lrp/AsnC family transcriptional regulator [Firmicutes bacterium]|nr:Lrp/AsnC family transcriptional regulator [Bacillota bacterium]